MSGSVHDVARLSPRAVAMAVSLIWAGVDRHGQGRSKRIAFGVNKFTNMIVNENREPATQAGSHPYAITTTIEFATHVPEAGSIAAEAELEPAPNGLAKEIEVGFPTGVIVNPTPPEKMHRDRARYHL